MSYVGAPRLVLDPCVLIAAAISPVGTAARLVRACRRGLAEMIVSPHLLWEVGVVLARPKFRPYLSRDEAREFVDDLRSWTTIRTDPSPWPEHLTYDRSDDYLVALARGYDASNVVSIDHHLLDVPGLLPPVVSPDVALAHLERERGAGRGWVRPGTAAPLDDRDHGR